MPRRRSPPARGQPGLLFEPLHRPQVPCSLSRFGSTRFIAHAGLDRALGGFYRATEMPSDISDRATLSIPEIRSGNNPRCCRTYRLRFDRLVIAVISDSAMRSIKTGAVAPGPAHSPPLPGRPQSLNELVYAELRRQILWGEIAAGSTLSVRRLSEVSCEPHAGPRRHPAPRSRGPRGGDASKRHARQLGVTRRRPRDRRGAQPSGGPGRAPGRVEPDQRRRQAAARAPPSDAGRRPGTIPRPGIRERRVSPCGHPPVRQPPSDAHDRRAVGPEHSALQRPRAEPGALPATPPGSTSASCRRS